jgi:hypothetical protein
VNKLPGFLDAQTANLFVMYTKARFQIKFGDDPVISSGVVALFCVFSFWPPGGQAKNQIGPTFGLSGHLT